MFTLDVILTCTENVAMATMVTHFNRPYIKLFNGARHNSLSPIEVEIEQFKSFTIDFGFNPVIY